MSSVIRKDFCAFLDNYYGSLAALSTHKITRFKNDIIPGNPLFFVLPHEIIRCK